MLLESHCRVALPSIICVVLGADIGSFNELLLAEANQGGVPCLDNGNLIAGPLRISLPSTAVCLRRTHSVPVCHVREGLLLGHIPQFTCLQIFYPLLT